jgi:peptide/nickel transport system substrate-binding protein
VTRRGGILTFAGRGDVDHLDPTCANYSASAVIERAYTRQLVAYPSTNRREQAGELIADLAERVPTRVNGGISEDGLRYTFTVREGARWDTAPARPVTARDVVRGIKRLGNPVARCPLLQYYADAITGLRSYCAGFRRVPPEPGAIADYLETVDLPGVSALDDRTVTFTLDHPTPDFLSMLTLAFASPAPAEYLAHLPASPGFDRSLRSCGPYRITHREPGRLLVLTRNPVWSQHADPVRRQYVERIEVRMGLTADEACEAVIAGDADVLWDTPPRLGDPAVLADHGELNPALIINFASPNAGRATSDLRVRRALAYALDKSAIARIYGESASVAGRLLPHGEPAAFYATEGGRGDPDRARKLLADAGYGNGLTLKMIYRDAGRHPAIARAVRESLGRAGIDVELVPVPQADFYPRYLERAAHARAGAWDITTQGWLPDWPGLNARSYLQPHFDSSDIGEHDETWGVVYGCYRNPATNDLIRRAVTAPDEASAGELFRRAEAQVMEDAAVVPILFQRSRTLHSARVRGFTGYPSYLGDPTHMWIAS